MAELQAIGQEAGLDADLVAAEAMAERGGQATQATWHGVPVGFERSRLLPDRLSEREWERVVDLLRSESRVPGAAQQIGRRREWTATSSSSSSMAALRVRVEERADGDLVTLTLPDSNRLLGLALGGTFAGMSGLIGAALAAGGTEMSKVLVIAAMMVLLGVFLYSAFFLSAKLAAVRAPDRLDGLLDRIDLISHLDDASPRMAARIDPLHLGAEAEALDTHVRPRHRTRS